ncbi:diaminopropionate ammonia-lyase [Aliikangiella marina]|uniref:diaminopropionate ammonia-lyase n=1 Tax=Aliikangiella marina TaxID=1712262 RepID=UPI00163DBE00|nr:diaminopropionate ammonia-lyase [Aliikangiella marina]
MSDTITFAKNHRLNTNVIAATESNSIIDDLVADNIGEAVTNFHHSIPQFNQSPLVELSDLATHLGLARIWVKDESTRFDLKAFKVLGASYAIAKQIQRLALPAELPLKFATLKEFAQTKDIHVATATDGNHGRAVAWCAKMLGCKAHVFMPHGSSEFRLAAIAKYAEQAEITDLNYDQTVAMVNQLAQKNEWVLIQDTAWNGYEVIPADIKRGYFSLLTEFDSQCVDDWPTHVFLQAGVGSMAAAIAAYLVKHPKPTPHLIIVEPDKAPCFYDSMKINDGKPHLYDGEMDTIMAGLACGLPSKTAWDILNASSIGTIKCQDIISEQGMRLYAKPMGNDKAIISGESAAVTLGLLKTLMEQKRFAQIRQQIALNKQSKVLLFSTEGDTDPILYQNIIGTAL